MAESLEEVRDATLHRMLPAVVVFYAALARRFPNVRPLSVSRATPYSVTATFRLPNGTECGMGISTLWVPRTPEVGGRQLLDAFAEQVGPHIPGGMDALRG